jgi:hypothetical protein
MLLNSSLRRSKTKRKKALSFKPTENENKEINSNNKEEYKDILFPNVKKEKIVFMNEEEKEGYCVNRYDNGDSYFGYYANDLRNYHGFYSYSPIDINDYKLNRYYLGFWRDDLRHGNGIYFWAKEKKNQKFFDNSNFRCFVGLFNSDNLDKGTYLSKEGDDYFVYHGTFSDNHKKNGKNCFYYSSNLENLLYGTFQDDKFVEGYIAKFNDEGEVDDIKKYNNDKAENMEKNNENSRIKELMATFRDCILSEDYFGIIFEVFANILKFKDNYVFNIDVINTYKHEDFLEICKSYKKINIYNDIEKYVK